MGIRSPKITSLNTQPVVTEDKTKKRPTVDLGACTKCGGCIEVAPQIFRFNEAVGYLEVIDADYYDKGLVDEAIRDCPTSCISWDS
jgi:ferredoxin